MIAQTDHQPSVGMQSLLAKLPLSLCMDMGHDGQVTDQKGPCDGKQNDHLQGRQHITTGN